ncbi:MAG: PepSY-associated TM helix domain-containing protein [Bacteroidales bacterium]
MGWRKWNRWLHRELGYLFFGMSIIYGISGIALNHFAARHWDPGVISRSESFTYPSPLTRSSVDREVIDRILEITGERKNYKQYYFPNEDHLMIYLQGGHISMTLSTGKMELILVRNRPVFREMNYLHYNKPKKLWTWFSDLYALSLVLMAVTGLFIVRGKKGITGRGGILTLIGVLLPLVFLLIYLWM